MILDIYDQIDDPAEDADDLAGDDDIDIDDDDDDEEEEDDDTDEAEDIE